MIALTKSKEELQIWIRLAVFKVTGIQPRTVVVLDILQVNKFIKIGEGVKKSGYFTVRRSEGGRRIKPLGPDHKQK